MIQLVVGGLVVLCMLGGAFVAGVRYERADHQAMELERKEIALETQRVQQKAITEAQSAHATKQLALQRAAADDRALVSELRDQLAGVRATAEAAAGADAERVRVLAGLLEEGAELAREGKERVERLDARLTSLQDAVKGLHVKN